MELDRIEFMDSAGVSALVRLREHARLPKQRETRTCA
jgi:anti-anti-sigma regulatory factor